MRVVQVLRLAQWIIECLHRFEPLADQDFQTLKAAMLNYIQSEYLQGPAESSAPCVWHFAHELSINIFNSINSPTEQVLAYIDVTLPLHVHGTVDDILHGYFRPHQSIRIFIISTHVQPTYFIIVLPSRS